jgi:hypothetical protein
MISNISSGKGFEGLLAYNENKIKSGDATLISKTNLISSKSVSVLSQFNMLDSRNTKKQNTTFHVSLNLPPGETVSDELFSDIADEYMKGMGYSAQPYVVYGHSDQAHQHIHIISCKIQENGKSISDSWERTKSQRTCTEIEKMYGLNQTNRIKPKGDELKTDLKLEDIPNENMHLRDRFSTTIHEILKEKKPTTIKEFKSELEKCNMSLVQSKGYSKNGNPIRGLKYFGLNENNKRDKYGIAASKLRLKPTLKYLDEKFKANLEFRKDIARKLRPQLNEIIKSFIKLSYDDFDKQCQQKGISLNYHRNSIGIYGLSFIDNKSGLKFKASDISKNLSWNVLKETLNEDLSLKYEDMHTKLNKELIKLMRASLHSYYFESQFLEAIHKEDIEEILKTQLQKDSSDRKSLREVLLKYVDPFLDIKYENLESIKRTENKFVNDTIDKRFGNLSLMINKSGTNLVDSLESLNLKIEENPDKTYAIYHKHKLNYKLVKDKTFFLEQGYELTSVSKDISKLNISIFQSLIGNPKSAPILFFNDKIKLEDLLNEKGLYKFNTIQNQKYVEGKILLFKRKNYSSRQLLRALSLRGVEFEIDNKGQLLAYFNKLEKNEVDGYIIPKEIVNSVNKKNITDEIFFQNSLSKYDNVHQRIMLNDALDINDINKVNFLMNNGVQYLLQNFEYDLMDNIDLNQCSSQSIEYEPADISSDSYSPIKSVILDSNSAGEGGDDEDDDEKIKKRKRKRWLHN